MLQEHKDQPGDVDNPDRDKEDIDTNGAAGSREAGRRYAASATDTGGTGASTASSVPGYVQSTVAHFNPPRTPAWSPTTQRVQVEH